MIVVRCLDRKIEMNEMFQKQLRFCVLCADKNMYIRFRPTAVVDLSKKTIGLRTIFFYL